MDVYRNLPTPLRLGIPAAVVLVLGLVLWMTMFNKEKTVEVYRSNDVEMLETAKLTLEQNGVDFSESRTDGVAALEVLEAKRSDAEAALMGSGLRARTDLAKTIECPAAPGFTATRSANERFDSCEKARQVQNSLLAAGATAANVSVTAEENGSLLGPEKSWNVQAQVFLPQRMADDWNAESAARAVAVMVGTSVDRVTITDDKLQPLFDGTSAASRATGSTVGNSLRGGCANMSGIDEIATKQAAVRDCYDSEISEKLRTLLGGTDRFVLVVNAEIVGEATTITKSSPTSGPITEQTESSGGGSTSGSKSRATGTENSVTVIPAGGIGSLKLSVTLDRNHVNLAQERAVRNLLGTYVDPSRKDPAPKVERIDFPAGVGKANEAADDELAKLQAAAQEAKANDTSTTMPTTGGGSGSKVLLAGMAVLVIGLLTAIAVLWRRGTRMAAERTVLEQEFRNEQRLLDNFAQQNPQDLARDLEAMFGAPSAPEPAMRP